MVSDRMLISILSISVEALEMCAEAADALVPPDGDLRAKDLLSPLCLMFIFNKIKFTVSVISFGA